MSNRIRECFSSLAAGKKKALIPYVTPEFPFRGMTLPLLQELERSGADLIEIGIPFSDPLADGPTVQHSSEVALANGVTTGSILEIVRRFRTGSRLPVVLMGYVNPILRYGAGKFMDDASRAGVDGLIIPDLPPEEAGTLREECRTAGLSMIFLIAPTTPDERVRRIDGLSTDFSYCVSVTGVTGARSRLGSNGSLSTFLERVRRNTKKPFVVGFGISNADQVQRVWNHADGAVVGSALIDVMGRESDSAGAISAAGVFFQSLRSRA